MKILFATNSECGGAERITLLYSKILKEKGFHSHLAVWFNKFYGFQLKPFIPEDLECELIKCPHKLLMIRLLISLWKFRPDVVFSSLSATSVGFIKLKKMGLIKAKVVVRECNMPSRHRPQILQNARKYYHDADVVIGQTEEMRKEIIQYYGLKPEMVKTVYNPIDRNLILEKLKENAGLDQQFVNYVAVGRVVPQKDFKTMLLAFAQVCKQQPKSRLYIIGNYKNDSVKKELENIIQDNNIGDRVFFEGLQDNPFKYVNEADAFLLSSTYEGLPNAMLEAMFIGKPVVVTTSIPFISQVVKEGVNGFLVPVGDYDSFAKRMMDAPTLKIEQKFVDIMNTDNELAKLFSSL